MSRKRTPPARATPKRAASIVAGLKIQLGPTKSRPGDRLKPDKGKKRPEGGARP